MNSAMTWAVLLGLFQSVADERLVRPFPTEVTAIIAQLPEEPQQYEQIATAAFNDLILDPDESDAVTFQRVETILRALLYHDGRTFQALLTVATLAHDHPGYGENGINSLAAIANYLRKGRPLPMAKQELERRLSDLNNDDELQHNVSECLRLLRKNYR